jgi:hypothetical protein
LKTAFPGLRLGVVCRSACIPTWQVRALEAVIAVPGVRPAAAVVGAKAASGSYAPWSWRWLKKAALSRVGSLATRDAGAALASFDARRDPSEPWACLAGADVVLWLGEGRPPEALLDATAEVWGLEHGDPAGLPGAAEVARGDRVVEARLVRYGRDEDAILWVGGFPTLSTWAATLDAVLSATADWPARAAKALLSGHPFPARPRPRDGQRGPRAASVALGAVKGPVERGLARLQAASSATKWNVGIADAPIHAFLEQRPPIAWLPDPGRRFLADPFAYESDGDVVLVVEDYDYDEVRAGLSTISVGSDGPGRLEPFLDRPEHLSYPYVFEHQGRLYCIPECSASGQVALYEVDKAARSCRRVATLLPDFAGVDTTVIRHEGRWWLLCTNARDNDCANLYVFYADDLLGPYTPHPWNPVKTDMRSSRPAGTPFVHQGVLYRPAQDCSERYGGAVAINRIVELTPHTFREEVVNVIRPDPNGPYPHGLHTLSAVGGKTVVDGNRLLGLKDAPRLVLSSRWAMTWRRRR